MFPFVCTTSSPVSSALVPSAPFWKLGGAGNVYCHCPACSVDVSLWNSCGRDCCPSPPQPQGGSARVWEDHLVVWTCGWVRSQVLAVCLCLYLDLCSPPNEPFLLCLTVKFGFGLCGAVIKKRKKKNPFPIQCEMSFKIIFPAFLACFCSPFAKSSFERFPVTLVQLCEPNILVRRGWWPWRPL